MLLIFMMVLVVAADVGAYFAGRAFGRVKLAPRVSPGKTWEGVVGGMASAGLVAVAGAYWLQLPTASFLALCAAVAVASVVGDLTESMFKRSVGLKDSGTLLPGHGGILDRIDSISAAAPVFALGLMWFGALR
jgi:phosphatidate cytidylyltransferase